MLLVATAALSAVAGWCASSLRTSEPVPPGSETPVEQPPHGAAPALAARPRASATETAELRAEVERLTRRLESIPAERADLEAGGVGDSSGREVAALVEQARRIRARAQALLLTPPESLVSRYAGFLDRADTGLARILRRGAYEHVIEKRGGGAYWSFATRDNDYDRQPDLELQNGQFLSGFYGANWGHLLDLGDVPIEGVGDREGLVPGGLDEKGRAVWSLLWEDAGTGLHGHTNAEWLERASALGVRRGPVPAVAGHSYVLRSFLFGEHDVLVVFRAIDADEHGMTLAWRMLKSWPVESRHRR
jgi:hypothetical protein